MSIYKVKLIKKEQIAEETMAFHFEKPINFDFKAGQYADYNLINPSEIDDEGIVRSFTFANAPYEDEIVFVTRMRNTAFKRVIRSMPVGTEVKLDGPNGNFIINVKTSTHIVFLTGGIGVTPAHSIIAQSIKEKLNQKNFISLESDN